MSGRGLPNTMKVTQVELQCLRERMVCWLPADDIKKGMLISLKGDPKIWKVREVYNTQEHYEINRKWDVGGL